VKVLHVIDHMGLGGEQRVVQDLAVMRAPDVEAAVRSLRSHELPGTADRMATAGVPYHRLGFSYGNPFAPAGFLRGGFGTPGPTSCTFISSAAT
jgi:hypothetical protein